MHQRGWRVRSIAACLVAGVIINFALAMACALWSPAGTWGGTLYARGEEPGSITRVWHKWYHDRGWSHKSNPSLEVTVSRGDGICVVLLDRSKFRERGTMPQSYIELRSGWPLYAMSTGREVYSLAAKGRTGPDAWEHAIPAPAWVRPVSLCLDRLGYFTYAIGILNEPRPIPLGVEWRGAVFGSGFWAGLILLIVTAARILREHRRMWRARCPACAYPLGDGGVCPECGTPLRVRAVPATPSSSASASSSLPLAPPAGPTQPSNEHNPPAAPVGS